MPTDPTITVQLAVDASGFERAMRDVRAAFAKMVPAINRAAHIWRSLTTPERVLVQQMVARYDLDNPQWRRNRTRDGRWQHTLCAAWLHGCPEPAATGCDCTCHGGTLR